MSKKYVWAEFRYRVGQELQRIRIENGYQSIHELAEASGMSLDLLMSLEMGNALELSPLCRLGRFYGKRLRIDFID